MKVFASYSKHAKLSKQYWLSSDDYKVVITPNSYHHIMITKLIILHLDSVNKPSPMSESVTEIQINSQPCKGVNQKTWHTQAQGAPWVVTIHDVTKKPGRVLPRPSVVFHMYASADTLWVAQTLSHYTPEIWGKVSSNSATHKATQFGDSICLVCVSTFQMLVHSDPTDVGLNQHRQGLSLWSSEFMI
jgi:hypothetical protein